MTLYGAFRGALRLVPSLVPDPDHPKRKRGRGLRPHTHSGKRWTTECVWRERGQLFTARPSVGIAGKCLQVLCVFQ